MTWTREIIRARLAAERPKNGRSDKATAEALRSRLDVVPYNRELHGAASPIPTPVAIPLDESKPRVAAAVLVPLVEYPAGFSVILTQRTPQLKAHAGQIAFPGGRMEPGDAGPEGGALRESQEEIGLAPEAVEVLGRLDPYVTVTGFEVIPVVGAVNPPLNFKADPTEVADIFEVPLAFFLDATNHQRHMLQLPGGQTRPYYAMPYQGRYIWGATAGMLLNLYEVLTGAK